MRRETIIVCIRHPDVEMTDVRHNQPLIRPPGTPKFIGRCTRCAPNPGHTHKYNYGKEVPKPRNRPEDATKGGTNG